MEGMRTHIATADTGDFDLYEDIGRVLEGWDWSVFKGDILD